MDKLIAARVTALMVEMKRHNRFLYDHPETAFKEHASSKILREWAVSHDFVIDQGQGKLETAFVARKIVGGGGPVIGFVAEYDALEDLGHACGHNLIAAMSCGAAFALAEAAAECSQNCEIRIIGCPAEENGGGKILMIEEGYFDGVDCAMMIHPSDRTMVEDFSFANQIFKYSFTGKAAHASAAPWEGSDAVEGMLQTFNLINGLRHQMKDYSRVNPLILESGKANNVIPDHAAMELNIRSADSDYLSELVEKVHRCAQMSAKVYELELIIEAKGLRYDSVSNNRVLESIMARHFEAQGEVVLDRPRDQGVGSTDMGNVTRVLPAIHGHIRLGSGLKTHTIPFREETISPEGKRVLEIGARVMAMTGMELINKTELFNSMLREFAQRGGGK